MFYNYDNLCFQILSVNRYSQKSGTYTINPRAFSALVFRLSGSSEVKTSENVFSLEAGDIFYMPAYMPYKATYKTDTEMLLIHFVDCNYTLPEKIEVRNKAYFQNLFQNMLNLWNNNHSMNEIKSEIYKLLHFIQTEGPKESSDILTFIDENISNCDFSVADICRTFNVSESTLRRQFIEHPGISPKQYLIKIRLEKAISLLFQGKHTIKEISLMCGFSDEKYFSRAVKAKYGQSPSAFKP